MGEIINNNNILKAWNRNLYDQTVCVFQWVCLSIHILSTHILWHQIHVLIKQRFLWIVHIKVSRVVIVVYGSVYAPPLAT